MRARHGKQTCFFFWPNAEYHTLTLILDRLSKNREEEEENTITFRLKCIVIA